VNPIARLTLAALPNVAKEAIADSLMPEARTRLRDIAICITIAELYPTRSTRAAAHALADELTGGGRPGTALGDAARAILALNNGKPLKGRRICTIAGGANSCATRRPIVAHAIASKRRDDAGIAK